MASQKAIIELDNRTIEALKSQAEAAGVSVDQLLNEFLLPNLSDQRNEVKAIDDFEAILDELVADQGSLPVLPKDFSREDIYADHP